MSLRDTLSSDVRAVDLGGSNVVRQQQPCVLKEVGVGYRVASEFV